MDERPDGQKRGGSRLVVELFGSDANGRKMIEWGRRIGCRARGPSGARLRRAAGRPGLAAPRLAKKMGKRFLARR